MLVTVLLLILIVAAAHKVNYCGSKMCGNTNMHTLCQYSKGPGPRCTGYIDAPLSLEEKARIVARLNRRRSEATSGKLRHLPPAGNMLKLRWVEDLAREAQRWANQCRPPSTPEENDVCRDLYSITVGQCVASVVGEAPGLRVESMVDMWYMQNIYYKSNVTTYIKPTNSYGYYGDFAQMTWARAYMVGCGRTKFMSSVRGRLRSVERLVCNFAPRGPTNGRTLWVPGTPASICPSRSRPDPELTALCTFQYDLDDPGHLNNSMSLEEHALLSTVLEIEKNEHLDYLGSLDELYLTKMVVVSIDPVTNDMYYNSVQKRDISEMVELIDANLDNNTSQSEVSSEQEITTTVLSQETMTIINRPKKRVTYIGRHKPYNMDELNDVGSDQKAQNDNHHTQKPTEEISDDEKEYDEYRFLETDEETTVSIQSESVSTTLYNDVDKTTVNYKLERSKHKISNNSIDVNLEERTAEDVSGINRIESVSIIMSNETSTQANFIEKFLRAPYLNLNTSNYIESDYNNTNESLSIDKRIEDYLSDPETVREIQEALDRMEHSLSTPLTTSVKVRRDLKGFPPELSESASSNDPGQNLRQYPKENFALAELNKTLDKAPMLNMVFRYMPYLKPYEGSIMPGVSSSAGFISSSVLNIVWFVIYCVYC